MRNQLVLIDRPSSDWRLDDRTKEVGRQGVAAARAALEEAARKALDHASRFPAA
jgi:hypothetical protein